MRAVPLAILATMLVASNAAHAAPSIETLPSGVKIEHVKIGEGSTPTATSQVTVHYRGTAKLICPPETAYGTRDLGKIPPNSTLNFEIQLLGSK